MPTEGREKGIKTPYTVRFSQGNPYAGVNKQGDAASILDTQGPDGINLRIVGGRPKSRPGQAKINTDVLEPIHGFHDSSRDELATEVENDGFLYMRGRNGSSEDILVVYDTVLQTLAHNVWSAAGVSYYQQLQPLIGSDGLVYGGSAKFTGADSNLAVHRITRSPFAKTLLWETASQTGPTGFSIAENPAAPLKFVRGHDLYPAYTGKVYYDDVLDDDNLVPAAGTEATPEFAGFAGSLYAAWGTGGGSFNLGTVVSDTIRRRTGIATWANLTMPATPNSPTLFTPYSYSGRGMNVFRSKLFVSGYYGGASPFYCYYLAIAPNGAVSIQHRVTGNGPPAWIETFDDRLCYFYGNGIATDVCKMGTFDGTTWTDVVWDCTIAGNGYFIMGAGSLGGYLYAIGRKGAESWLLRSSGTNLSTWTALIRLDAGGTTLANGPIAGEPLP